jgi:hypothetical protein
LPVNVGWDKSTIKEINEGQLPAHLFGLDTQKKFAKKGAITLLLVTCSHKPKHIAWEDARPKVEETLMQMKQRHLDRLKGQRFLKHWNMFGVNFDEWNRTQILDSSIRPRRVDIAVLEPFNTIIFVSDTEEAEFKIDDIDRIAKEWVEWRENFLFSLLPQDLQDHFQANKLPLPSLVIFCFSSKTLHNATLKRIRIEREYLDSNKSLTSDDREIHEAFKRAGFFYIRPWQWSNGDLQFDTREFETALRALECLGLDPYTTSGTQLAGQLALVEDHTQLYGCRTCREEKHGISQDGVSLLLLH